MPRRGPRSESGAALVACAPMRQRTKKGRQYLSADAWVAYAWDWPLKQIPSGCMHAWPADWPPRHVCGARCIRLPCLCSTELLSACDCGATNGMCWICPQCFEPIGLAGAAAVVVLNHLHRVLPGAPVRG